MMSKKSGLNRKGAEMENEKKLAREIERQLNGKTVSQIHLPRPNDCCIKFTDGTRLFVTSPNENTLDISITGDSDEQRT